MRILVTGASRHGSTREIADAIAAELQAAGLDADLRDAGSVTSMDGYDAIIIGSAVYMGDWMPEAKQLIERFERHLQTLPVWLFSSGPLGDDDPQPAGEPARVVDLIEQINPRNHHVFTGKLDREGLRFSERMITKMVHAPEGDFRDWDAIASWAHDIGSELTASDVEPPTLS